MGELSYDTIKTELGLWILDPVDIELIAEQHCPNQRIKSDMPVGDFVCDALTNPANYSSNRTPYKARNQAISGKAKFDTLAIVIPKIADIPISKLNKRFSHEYYDRILADECELNMIRKMWNTQLTQEMRKTLLRGIMPGGARGKGKRKFEVARSEFWRWMKPTLQGVHLKNVIKSFEDNSSKPTEVDHTHTHAYDQHDIDEQHTIETDTETQKDPTSQQDTELRQAVTDAIRDLNGIPTTAPIGGYYNWLRASISPAVRAKGKRATSKGDPKPKDIADRNQNSPDEETQGAVYPFLTFITEFFSDDGEKYYTKTTGLTTQKNAWESGSQNLFILIDRYLGTEKFDTINLRTGKHRDAISKHQDFSTLKNEAHAFLEEPADANPKRLNALLDPISTPQDDHKSRVVYELFYRVLGATGKDNTQIKRGTFWQTHYLKIILNQWIASLNEKLRYNETQSYIVYPEPLKLRELVLVDLDNLDKGADPLLKPFMIENGALKVKEKIQVEDLQEFFRALWEIKVRIRS